MSKKTLPNGVSILPSILPFSPQYSHFSPWKGTAQHNKFIWATDLLKSPRKITPDCKTNALVRIESFFPEERVNVSDIQNVIKSCFFRAQF